MKYINTKHWTVIKDQQGILFFAQTLTEALFDYTLDTYKPQALNTRLLCVEALQTIDQIKIGLIKKPNIDSIIEELLWSLQNDFTAKELIGSKYDEIINNINTNRNNDKKLKDFILYLYHFLDNKKYLKALENTLRSIIPQHKEKNKIYKSTRSYLTELINYGYSPSYVYHNTYTYFFNQSVPFSAVDPIDFFKLFNFKKKKFTVVYKVSKLFKEFESLSKGYNFKVVESFSLKNLKGAEKEFIKSKGSENLFIVFRDEAIEDNASRLQTENPLFEIGNLFSFYHHKERPKISEQALVINHTDNFSLLREDPTKSIIKIADIKPAVAALKVKELLLNLELAPDTIYRIRRAIELHSISLTTEQIEIKLLNLWTALETLIPKDMESGVDRIVQIIKAIKPFQTLKYIDKIIEQAGSDFWHFDKSNAKKILNSVVTTVKESRTTTLAALIMTSENEANRKQIYSLLERYPLLRFRLFSLNKYLSNGKEVGKFLNNHCQKVEWQIRRIYRVRNLIVHSGNMPTYTNILVENLHNYFDDFLNYIIDNAIREKRIRTINEAILNAEIECKILSTNILSIGDTNILLDNFKKIIQST